MSQPASRVSQLSQDIVDEIISWLPVVGGGSQEAALVCKAWLTPARRNIFKFAQVWPHHRHKGSSTRLLSLLEVIGTTGEIAKYVRTIHWLWWPWEQDNKMAFEEQFPGDTLARLGRLTKEHNINHTFDLSMLDDAAQAHFLMQVLDQAQELTEHVTEIRWHCALPGAPHSAKHVEMVLNLIRRLPALDKLQLLPHHRDDNPFPHKHLSEALAVCRMTSLELSFAEFPTETAFCVFLSHLAHLSRIRLQGVKVTQTTEPHDSELQAVVPVPPLKSINIDTCNSISVALMRWLHTTSRLSQPSDITLPSHGSFTSLLLLCEGVITLEITCTTNDPFDGGLKEWGPADISACRQLEHLTVIAQGPSCHRLLASTLDTMTSEAIKSLRLAIYDEPNSEQWEMLRTSLSQPCFMRLPGLSVTGPSEEGGRAGIDRARKQLLPVNIRGNICFIPVERRPGDVFHINLTAVAPPEPPSSHSWGRRLVQWLSSIPASVNSWLSGTSH